MSAMTTAYHITDGPTLMYDIDAKSAVGHHPKEWSLEPWPASAKPKTATGEPPAAIDIPENWKELPGPERIGLARKLGRKGNFGAEKADQAIEAYLKEHTSVQDEEAAT